MKYLAAIILASAVFIVSSSSAKALSETIDNISIPMDVTIGVQLDYQGMAINQAHKEGSNYVLRVDHDSNTNDSNAFYLVYSSNWTLLGQKRVVLQEPPKAQPEKPSVAPTPPPQPQQELPKPPKPEIRPPESKPNKPEKPNNGNGHGSDN